MGRLFSAFLLPILFGLVSCGGEPDTRPDVVVIVIDTLRADHLPLLGYEKETAPFLTELAESRGAWALAHSTSSWTAPASASLHTSTQAIQHGVRDGFRATQVRRRNDTSIRVDRIPDELETMAEAFHEAGYATFGVADNRNICREMGFDQGFERFSTMNYEGADAVNARVMAWSDAIDAARPYFLYLHYMDPHRPYNQHDSSYRPTGDERLDQIAAYDSEIAFVDARIRALHDRFGWDENTVIVVTSDHGEEFLEHGGWDHGRTLYP
jgi:arylsulfatase A-like enzyme